jgi:hypothetical protein
VNISVAENAFHCENFLISNYDLWTPNQSKLRIIDRFALQGIYCAMYCSYKRSLYTMVMCILSFVLSPVWHTKSLTNPLCKLTHLHHVLTEACDASQNNHNYNFTGQKVFIFGTRNLSDICLVFPVGFVWCIGSVLPKEITSHQIFSLSAHNTWVLDQMFK